MVMKLNKLVKKGTIGKILSTNLVGHVAELGLALSHGLKYVAF